MRKKIKRRKKRLTAMPAITIFITIFILGTSIAYSKCSEVLTVIGTATGHNQNTPIITEDVELEYKEHYKNGNKYYYTYEFTIKNNTQSDFYSWRVLIGNLPSSASDFSNWNNEVESVDTTKGEAILTEKGWNGTGASWETVGPIRFRFSTTEEIDVNRLTASLILDAPDPEDPEEPEEPDNPDIPGNILNKIKIEFAVTSAYDQVIQYKITIKNNSDITINSCTFNINLPDNTTHTIWTTTCTNNGNTYTSNVTIQPGGNTEIYGQFTLPDGVNKNKYRNPKITVTCAN